MLMAMSRSKAMANLVGRFTQLGATRVQIRPFSYSTFTQTQMSDRSNVGEVALLRGQCNNQPMYHDSGKEAASVHKHQIGENVSRKDKIDFLVTTLLDLKDSKEAVYGALDAWVAWEQKFPIASLKRVLITLEKEQQWHRVIQVIKWMLSKGQGTTMGTFGQLIRALDMDHRAEEAHKFWVKKIGTDLHSVPWQLCHLMISVYYRNDMLENLVKLFKGLEAFDRKPPDKLLVKKVADAYEMLGLLEEKERILEKYDYLFTERAAGKPKKSKTFLYTEKKSGTGAKCSADGPTVNQTQVGFGNPPKFMVEVHNNCAMCPVIDVHIKCGNFSQALVSPRLLKVLGHDDCVVDAGLPLPPLQKFSFSYSHQKYPMYPSTWYFQCE